MTGSEHLGWIFRHSQAAAICQIKHKLQWFFMKPHKKEKKEQEVCSAKRKETEKNSMSKKPLKVSCLAKSRVNNR